MQTILDGACTALAESGLALKYWAEAVSTVVYVRNFIPSSQNQEIFQEKFGLAVDKMWPT